jgi:hypothetical protein
LGEDGHGVADPDPALLGTGEARQHDAGHISTCSSLKLSGAGAKFAMASGTSTYSAWVRHGIAKFPAADRLAPVRRADAIL